MCVYSSGLDVILEHTYIYFNELANLAMANFLYSHELEMVFTLLKYCKN